MGDIKEKYRITKRSLEANQKVNVIGQVIKEDIHLLNYIKEEQIHDLVERITICYD